MAMVLDAFVGIFVERLAKLAEDEIIMLLDLENDLETLQTKLRNLHALLSDAESKKISDESVHLWLSSFRNLMYDADDLFDDFLIHPKPQPTPSRLFSCFPSVTTRHAIAVRLKSLNSELSKLDSDVGRLHLVTSLPDTVSKPRRLETSWVVVEKDIIGMDQDAAGLVDLLTGNTRKQKCPVYAITGMPGIGKSTLAQKVFNSAAIVSHFDLLIWLCVSKDYDDVEILKETVRIMTKSVKEKGKGELYGDANKKSELDAIVQDIIVNKRFLLVLDDVWDSRVWEGLLRSPLYRGADDSKVLITTRNKIITMGMGVAYIHEMKEMPEKDGWLMLCNNVFGEGEESEVVRFKEVGMEIVKKCKCLPLALKTVGGVLKTKDRTISAWRRVALSQIWALPTLPEDVKPGLLLSYDDLPPHLKQCLIYSSLFPEDFRFHQPTLVQMWIAEGFVKGEETDVSLEELGDDYYRELVMRNLLQAMPDYYDRLGCRMHDLVRSLAHYVSRNDYFYSNSRSKSCDLDRPRHLSLVKEALEVPEIKKKYQCLRTLLLSRNPSIKTIPSDCFDNLKRLRVLDVAYTGIKSLPESLGGLVHLRFLNVSFTKLRGLPESIQYLHNLETLKANGSKHLHKLPAGIVMLKNLRHLAVGAGETQLDYTPVEMGNLKNLRMLKGFVVNGGNQSEGNHNEPNMKELKNLSELTDLSMYKLERVVSRAEAEEATLGDKTKLKYLMLSCSRRRKTQQLEDEAIKRIEEVFEGINPPSSLEKLHINAFFGRRLPTCVARCSLLELRWLRLEECKLVKQLPPLGRLPELTVLHIWGATAVSKIGPEFFGGALGFPKLQDLYLWGMPKLEQVSKIENGAFRCLKRLHIDKCPKIKSLPEGLEHVTTLIQLVVESCENLEAIANLSSVSILKIKGNLNLKSVLMLPSLNIMTVDKCPALRNVGCINNLKYLTLSDDKMEAIPPWLTDSISLVKLDVKGSNNLVTRCCHGGGDWPSVERILQVEVRSADGLSYMSYRKEPFSFKSNLVDSVGVSSPSINVDASANEDSDDEYARMSFGSAYEP